MEFKTVVLMWLIKEFCLKEKKKGGGADKEFNIKEIGQFALGLFRAGHTAPTVDQWFSNFLPNLYSKLNGVLFNFYSLKNPEKSNITVFNIENKKYFLSSRSAY